MEICYPAIILLIIAIIIAIKIGRTAWWGAGIVLGSVPLFFAIISFILCKKGYRKLSWLAPFLSAVLVLGYIGMNI